MPVKAKTKVSAAKAKTVTAKAKAKAAPKDEREANRLRQQRFLDVHREEVNQKRRERYAERKEDGLCPRCGKKMRTAKKTLCKDCLEKAKDYNRKLASLQ